MSNTYSFHQAPVRHLLGDLGFSSFAFSQNFVKLPMILLYLCITWFYFNIENYLLSQSFSSLVFQAKKSAKVVYPLWTRSNYLRINRITNQAHHSEHSKCLAALNDNKQTTSIRPTPVFSELELH